MLYVVRTMPRIDKHIALIGTSNGSLPLTYKWYITIVFQITSNTARSCSTKMDNAISSYEILAFEKSSSG